MLTCALTENGWFSETFAAMAAGLCIAAEDHIIELVLQQNRQPQQHIIVI